ncbi:MAG: 30S ribosomal protein S20 [Candidatus Eisenbacteria bacterium]|nr:30S ribosomal protein S20 [Candidatus Eisenbacteria bacterium]
MPHHKSAKHRVKTNARDNSKNRAVMSEVRSSVRTVRDKAEAKDAAAPATYREAASVLDRAVRKGVLKKATANRQKARLARAIARG